MQASPPYDLGDGDVPLFVFLRIEKGTGKFLGGTVAPEAPWHYNGYTSIIATRKDKVSGKSFKSVPLVLAELNDLNLTKAEAIRNGLFTHQTLADRLITDALAEIEITQAIKQADMPLIPHPFLGNDLRNSEIIMLDPVSVKTEKLLALHDTGESVLELINNGKITFGNTALNRITPAGVMAVDFTL